MGRKGRRRRSKDGTTVSPEARGKSSAPLRRPAIAWPTLPIPGSESRAVPVNPALAPGVALDAVNQLSRPLDLAPEPPSAPPSRGESNYPAVAIEDRFFESSRLDFQSSSDLDAHDLRLSLRLTPTAARRRAQLAQYVKVAMGLSLALCFAALVKAAIVRRHPEGDAPRASSASVSPVAVPVQTGAAIAPRHAANELTTQGAADLTPPATSTPFPTPSEPGAKAEPLAAGAASANPALPKGSAQVARAETTTAAGGVTTDPEQAFKQKKASQGALERGQVRTSIEAGERSVGLDPTDGEAWLILGAAYQQQGNGEDARRCYNACLRQGNRGPKGECAAMLR